MLVLFDEERKVLSQVCYSGREGLWLSRGSKESLSLRVALLVCIAFDDTLITSMFVRTWLICPCPAVLSARHVITYIVIPVWLVGGLDGYEYPGNYLPTGLSYICRAR